MDLTQGQTAVIDAGDATLVGSFRWAASWNSDIKGYYAMTPAKRHDGRSTTLYMHRLITGAPKGTYVDHINHDTLDNRRANLRLVTNSENMVNRRGANANSKTGIRGVSVHRCKPSGLMYVARFHKPAGQGYACKYFPFTPEGLIEAARTVNVFLSEHMAPLAADTPENAAIPASAPLIHALMCDAYRDALATSGTRSHRSAEVWYARDTNKERV